MAPKSKFLDQLLPDSASDSSEEGEQEAAGSEEERVEAAKKQRKEVSLADLQRAGYKSGPSVLHIRAPQEEDTTNYEWSDGREARSNQEEETLEERRATQIAATVGADTTARFAQAAVLQAERAREQRRAEREEQMADRKGLTFNQKEKRKRDEGKQARGKSYVEEEKRLQRQLGMFSGFD